MNQSPQKLIDLADELSKIANNLRLIAYNLQKNQADQDLIRFYNKIDLINKRRARKGAPPIIPLITDDFNCVPIESAYPSPTIDNG